jgi:hypothetical protein
VQNQDLPPVYYTLSSILGLFSYPDIWQGAAWATPTTLNRIRSELKSYILGCSYNGGGWPCCLWRCTGGGGNSNLACAACP